MIIPVELLQNHQAITHVAHILTATASQAKTVKWKRDSLRKNLHPDGQVLLDVVYEQFGNDVDLKHHTLGKCSLALHQWLVWDALVSVQVRGVLSTNQVAVKVAALNWIREPGVGTKAIAYKTYQSNWDHSDYYRAGPRDSAAFACYIAGITRIPSDKYQACINAYLYRSSPGSSWSGPQVGKGFHSRTPSGYTVAESRVKLLHLLSPYLPKPVVQNFVR